MRLFATIFIAVMGVLSACSDDGRSTNWCRYSTDEMRSLEIAAARNDLNAIRDLAYCYDKDGRLRESEELYARLVELGDPNAIISDIYVQMARASEAQNIRNKCVIMSVQRQRVLNLATQQNNPNGESEALYQRIVRKMTEQNCTIVD